VLYRLSYMGAQLSNTDRTRRQKIISRRFIRD
jgi:hypothetical protein